MKRLKFLTIFAIVFMGVLSFAFVGCADKNTGNEPENPQDPVAVTTFHIVLKKMPLILLAVK